MDTRSIARQNMFVSVNQFGENNPADFSANTTAVNNFAAVAEVIGKLRDHSAAQTSGAVGRTTTQKSVLRDAIRTKMKEIARTARALGIDNVGLHQLFSVPNNNNDTELTATAREFSSEAQKFKADFISLGMTDDFIEDLTADITAFDQALNEKATARVEGVTATASIDDEIERGMKAVKILDAIVRNIYRNNSAKLAAWTSAKHISRSAKPSKTEPPTA